MFNVKVVNSESQHKNFYDAFKALYDGVSKMVDEGTSWQALETFVWIEYENEGKKIPMFWYDARDLAYELGLLVEKGKEVQEVPKENQMTEKFFETVFTAVAENYFDSFIEELKEIVKKIGLSGTEIEEMLIKIENPG